MENRRSSKNVWSWIAIGLVVCFVAATMFYDVSRNEVTSPHTSGDAWNSMMLLGSADAPNRFVEYTDYFCSFCEKVQKTTGEEFQKDYIDSGKLSFENRIITVLKEVSPNTEQGAEAAYCSADQDKYWEYSRHLVPRIKADYWDKGIGTKENIANPVPIQKLPLEYFTVSARAVGLDVAKFESCMANAEHQQEIEAATERAVRLGVSGLPYMVVNDYTSNGFVGNYDSLKMVLKAGGVK